MTPEEILEGAGDVIRRDGWLQGDTDDEHGRVCLMGAIARAATGTARHEGVNVNLDGPIPEVNEAVQRVINTIGTINVGNWNDEPQRTVEDVLLTLKKAIES